MQQSGAGLDKLTENKKQAGFSLVRGAQGIVKKVLWKCPGDNLQRAGKQVPERGKGGVLGAGRNRRNFDPRESILGKEGASSGRTPWRQNSMPAKKKNLLTQGNFGDLEGRSTSVAKPGTHNLQT